MKIIYVTNARIPTEKAHGLQIIKTCEALAALNNEVELWLPTRKNSIKEDVFNFYEIKNNFKIFYIKGFDFFRGYKILGSWAFKLQSLWFWLHLGFKKFGLADLVYTRNAEIAWLFNKKGYWVFYEAHVWPLSKNWLFKFMLKEVDGIVCNSHGTAAAFKKRNYRNILVAPNGVNIDRFAIEIDKKIARDKLSLPVDKRIVLYSGHLYHWKGVDTVMASAKLLHDDQNILFVLLGGTEEDIKKYQLEIKIKQLKNITLVGFKPTREVPLYLKAADVLLLPNIPVTEEALAYTSPIKMFEYMASGVPIIASDLPSIREVLNTQNSYLVPAGDVTILSQKIKEVLAKDNNLITKQAFQDVQEFSWQKRAEKILRFAQI